jgi:hypothetical protein
MGWRAEAEPGGEGDEAEGVKMRRHGRTDANQTEIVAALRGIGAHVQSLADVGKGCPDLLVSFRGAWFVLKLKSPGGKLTDDERDWHNAARASVFVDWG